MAGRLQTQGRIRKEKGTCPLNDSLSFLYIPWNLRVVEPPFIFLPPFLFPVPGLSTLNRLTPNSNMNWGNRLTGHEETRDRWEESCCGEASWETTIRVPHSFLILVTTNWLSTDGLSFPTFLFPAVDLELDLESNSQQSSLLIPSLWVLPQQESWEDRLGKKRKGEKGKGSCVWSWACCRRVNDSPFNSQL
jgi:hypothetical protein